MLLCCGGVEGHIHAIIAGEEKGGVGKADVGCLDALFYFFQIDVSEVAIDIIFGVLYLNEDEKLALPAAFGQFNAIDSNFHLRG